MTNKIQHKRSSTLNNPPGSLDAGEIAINTNAASANIHFEDAGGDMRSVGADPTVAGTYVRTIASDNAVGTWVAANSVPGTGDGSGNFGFWNRDDGTDTLSPREDDDNLDMGAGDITTTGDISGADGTFTGDVTLSGAGENLIFTGSDDTPTDRTISLNAPINDAAFTANYSLTLPPNDGNADQVLTTNGSGALSWTTPLTQGVADSRYLRVDAGAGDQERVSGEVTFDELTTHEAGIRSNGAIYSIKDTGFPSTAESFDRFAAFEGNMRVDDMSVVGQGIHFYNYRFIDGNTNQQTDVYIVDAQGNSETFDATNRSYIRFNSQGSPGVKNIGSISFGGFGQTQSANRESFKIYNTSDGLETTSGSTTNVARLSFPASENGSVRKTLSFISRRINDGNTNNQQALSVEATRGAIRFDHGNSQALGFYWNNNGTWESAGTMSNGNWSGLNFRNVTVELDGDQEAAFTTSYSTDEDGEQVETQTYNGETQTLQSIIRELKTKNEALKLRIEALESGEVNDDANDSALLTLVANLSTRLAALEAD